jgi:hypothetical protein
MSKLSTLMFLAILAGCGGAKHPLSTDDGGAGATGSGTGGSLAGTGGSFAGTGGSFAGTGGGGGTTSTGGSGAGTGGITGGVGGSQGGGGAGGFGGVFGSIPDGGLNGILDSGVLNGILDSGLVGGCPNNPAGQACGPGMPPFCYTPAADGGTPSACYCMGTQWVCPTLGGLGDAGSGVTACPANAMGMSCTQGALCVRPGGGCLCFGGTWMCR